MARSVSRKVAHAYASEANVFTLVLCQCVFSDCWVSLERLLLIDTEEKRPAKSIHTWNKDLSKITIQMNCVDVFVSHACLASWMWSNDDNLAQCICATLSNCIEYRAFVNVNRFMQTSNLCSRHRTANWIASLNLFSLNWNTSSLADLFLSSVCAIKVSDIRYKSKQKYIYIYTIYSISDCLFNGVQFSIKWPTT